jgi:hypothetical protein
MSETVSAAVITPLTNLPPRFAISSASLIKDWVLCSNSLRLILPPVLGFVAVPAGFVPTCVPTLTGALIVPDDPVDPETPEVPEVPVAPCGV